MVYHVLNRANSRRRLFYGDKDYLAFLKVLGEARARFPGVELFSLCVMPNHWHLVVRPSRDGELSLFMRWLAQTHTQRFRHAKHSVGYGALYQGRFKSFLVEEDGHFLILCRYVERNALRGKLVKQVEAWRWSSAAIRLSGDEAMQNLLDEWPVSRPQNWLALLNEAQTELDEQRVAESINRNRPLGEPEWMQKMVKRMGLEHTIRRPGRPAKKKKRERR
jgi:putative transposase